MASITFLGQSSASHILSLLALPVLLWILFSLYAQYKAKSRNTQLTHQYGCEAPPSYPHLDPILGLDYFWRNLKSLKDHHLMDDMTQRFKDVNGGVTTYSYTAMGKTLICTIDPENIKSIWVTNPKSYIISPQRQRNLSRILGQGIFTTNGHLWEESRTMLRPNFSRAQTNDLSVHETHIQDLVKAIRKADGTVVDLQKLFPRLTMDLASELFYGHSTFSLREDGDPKAKLFVDTFDDISLRVAQRHRAGALAALLPRKEFHAGVKYLNDFVAEKVDETIRKRETKSQDSIDTLDVKNDTKGQYILMDELAQSGVPPERIRAELLSVITAGRDTTASLLSMCFYTLARRPDVIARLRQEIAQEVGSKPPTYAQLRNMRYLRWTLNETLRLYPIIPYNGRVCIEDTTIPQGGGVDGTSPIFIPKGTRIFLIIYALHRREDIYGPDALDFKPERWEDLKAGYAYQPFGAGPRVCIGQQLALTTAAYTVVRLLQEFRTLEAGDDTEWVERMTLAMSCQHGVKVVLKS